MPYNDIIVIAIVVLTLINIFHGVMRCRQRCIEQRTHYENGGNEANDQSRQRNSDPENQISLNQLNMQMREERRLRILIGVVHKKAVAKTKEGEDQVTLPHEEELSNRPWISGGYLEDDTHHEEQLKTNITISSTDTLSSSDSNLNDSGQNFSDTGSEDDKSTLIYSPKTCAICLDAYRAGDDICWSKNENCHHAFHLECLTIWLMDNDECPLCRENYLEEV